MVAFLAGRFTGTALMKRVSAERLLLVFAVVNVALVIVAMSVPGTVGACALVACSFFMSVMYPTIFGLAVRDRDDEERKIGSALLVMTIIGGAVLTALLGAVSDRFGIAHAMVVPGVAFVVVAAFARHHVRTHA
jgi:FHS family L-fucose permease-like MFS transporter